MSEDRFGYLMKGELEEYIFQRVVEDCSTLPKIYNAISNGSLSCGGNHLKDKKIYKVRGSR